MHSQYFVTPVFLSIDPFRFQLSLTFKRFIPNWMIRSLQPDCAPMEHLYNLIFKHKLRVLDIFLNIPNQTSNHRCSRKWLSDPGVPGVRSMGPDSLTHSLTTRLCADLSDVTLADEDSNSIPTDDVNRAFPGNVAMQVAPSDGQH